MHKPIKQLIILIVVLLTFFPYLQVANVAGIDPTVLLTGAGLVLQLASIGILAYCYLKSPSDSLKLFWQYVLLACITGVIARYVAFDTSSTSSLLLGDFIILFVFFFAILAIETNPHLSESSRRNYIAGSVPAVFFTLACFGYFVLLPIEFADTKYLTGQNSALFVTLVACLLAIRVTVCVYGSEHKFWRVMFALLGLSIVATLLSLSTYLYQQALTTQSHYGLGVLSLLPFSVLIMSAFSTIISRYQPPSIKVAKEPERYILALMLVISVVHLYGLEAQPFYIVGSHLQSAIVGLWLLLGALFLLNLSHKRRKKTIELVDKIDLNDVHIEQLSEQKEHLASSLVNSEDKAIVSVSNNAILTTQTDGKILSANPSAVQMFQCLEQELVGTSVSKLFSEKDEMHLFFDFQSNVYALQRKEMGISIECTSLRSDGTEFPAQAELQWAEREDKPLIVITFINLTARKLAEKQTLELKDKFIANISHEFRTPLTIINGIIDGYLAQTTDVDESLDLQTAKRNGLRLVRMVEQLLELSRLSDNPRLQLNHFRLSTLMAMPVDSFSRLAAQQELTFSSKIPEDIWIECDAQAYEKIIFNLLSNAVKYTPAGGDIKVNAYVEQDTVILDVIDSGIGIHKTSQDKIFERFARADDVLNQNTFGVGIGLSLVNELVRTHGWRIGLVSEAGKGSKFSLSIPIAVAQEQEAQLPEGLSQNEVSSILVEQRSVTSSQNTHSQQVVLVIEDNMDMQGHIKKVVERQHHCILAGNGEQGVELAKEYVPDLIVSDLMLPGIDGFEVLKQTKEHEITAHIPVILLTARSDLDSRIKGLNMQADEYLSKPFNQDELLTRIQNLIDGRKQLQKAFMVKHEQGEKEKRKQDSQEKVAKLTETPEETSSLDEKFLNRLEELVADLYTDPSLDIYQLADKLAMSERQLQRKLKVLLGTNPNNFIREFRLKKAKDMLKSGTQIGIVAFDVGFSSQTYFGRCFKEAFSCTPKQYQQKIKEEQGET